MATYSPCIISTGERRWKDDSGADATLRQLCVTNEGKIKLKLASGYGDPIVDSSGRRKFKYTPTYIAITIPSFPGFTGGSAIFSVASEDATTITYSATCPIVASCGNVGIYNGFSANVTRNKSTKLVSADFVWYGGTYAERVVVSCTAGNSAGVATITCGGTTYAFALQTALTKGATTWGSCPAYNTYSNSFGDAFYLYHNS